MNNSNKAELDFAQQSKDKEQQAIYEERLNRGQSKLLFAFATWLCRDGNHENRTAPTSELELNEELCRSLDVFAKANGLKKPDDYEGIVFPSYDY